MTDRVTGDPTNERVSCPRGADCALNKGAGHCKACGRNWPPDETWAGDPTNEKQADWAPSDVAEALRRLETIAFHSPPEPLRESDAWALLSERRHRLAALSRQQNTIDAAESAYRLICVNDPTNVDEHIERLGAALAALRDGQTE